MKRSSDHDYGNFMKPATIKIHVGRNPFNLNTKQKQNTKQASWCKLFLDYARFLEKDVRIWALFVHQILAQNLITMAGDFVAE